MKNQLLMTNFKSNINMFFTNYFMWIFKAATSLYQGLVNIDCQHQTSNNKPNKREKNNTNQHHQQTQEAKE